MTPALAGTTAQRAKSFTNSVGIGLQNNTGATPAYAALSAMGVTMVRASIPIPGEDGINFNNNYLAAHGIRFNFIWLNGFGNFLITDCANIATSIAGVIALEDTFVATYPGAMLANEGVNETNNFGACYTNSAVATGGSGAVIKFIAVPADLVTAANATYTDPGTIYVGTGFTVTDVTTPAAIPPNTTIVSATTTSVTLSASTTVKAGDTIQFQAQGVEPSKSNVNAASSLGWQAAIYNATHADPILTGAGVKVANYTGYIYGAMPNPPSVPGTADYNTFHFYTNPSYIQPTAYTGEFMAAFLNPANQPIAGLRTVVTETGWCTGTGTAGLVDQTTQAIFLLNNYFDMFSAGVPYTTVYTMFDYNTGDNNCYDNYGVYESDQTTPKAAATAIKNMQTILGDSGSTALTFTPGTLNYSIVGLPSTGFDFLLQKSNGTWDIVVWNEPQIWDDATHAQVTPSIATVTVDLGSMFAAVNVYDPVNGATPISTASKVNSVTLTVGAHPLFVEAIPLTSTHDFKGDGKSDIAWRNTNGDIAIWLMNGPQTLSSPDIGNVPTSWSWSIVGQRQLNNSGCADLIWRNTNGDLAIWFMNGTQVVSAPDLGNVPTSWSVAGTSAYNGTYAELIWRNTDGDVAIWQMNGTQLLASPDLGIVPTSWMIAGTGDFSGTGNTDILWRDTAGNVAIWFMNGTQVVSMPVLGNVPTSWTIVGTGDFNGDGKTDILWRNANGDVAIWLMNGTQAVSAPDLGNVPTNWSIAETGDFNGDGYSDILWRDTAGDVAIWFMNGTQVVSAPGIGNVPTSWTIQGANAD